MAGAVLVLTGCVGTVSRDEFEAEVRSRGGGFDEDLVIEAVDHVARDVGTPDFEITGLTASMPAGVVTMDVRDPKRPDRLDDYTFRGGDLVSVEPVQLSASDDLDAEAFPISDFALDQLDEMVDASIEAFDAEDGYAQTVTFHAQPSAEDPARLEPLVRVHLESSRASAMTTLAPDGRLLSVEPL